MEMIYLIPPAVTLLSLFLSQLSLYFDEDRLEAPMNHVMCKPKVSRIQHFCIRIYESLILMRDDIIRGSKLLFCVFTFVLVVLVFAMVRLDFRTFDHPFMTHVWIMAFSLLFFLFSLSFKEEYQRIRRVLGHIIEQESYHECFVLLCRKYRLLYRAYLALSLLLCVYLFIILKYHIECI